MVRDPKGIRILGPYPRLVLANKTKKGNKTEKANKAKKANWTEKANWTGKANEGRKANGTEKMPMQKRVLPRWISQRTLIISLFLLSPSLLWSVMAVLLNILAVARELRRCRLYVMADSGGN
ncbi:hypothetical protein N7535_000152 [Penicillium sp. DV-2018c]|nr:hypothetical protein N7535_000152 [Penicillium sp. DV-2018c]